MGEIIKTLEPTNWHKLALTKPIDQTKDLMGMNKSKSPDSQTAPVPDDQASARAESRKLQRKKRTGRMSTVLTPGTNLG